MSKKEIIKVQRYQNSLKVQRGRIQWGLPGTKCFSENLGRRAGVRLGIHGNSKHLAYISDVMSV